VLGLIFYIVFERRSNRVLAFLATALAISVDWARYLDIYGAHERELALVYHAALVLLSGFATYVILRNIFRQREVSGDDVLGAASGYLLAAAAWANLYSLVEILRPGAFAMGELMAGDQLAWHWRIAVFNYISLGTLTSVGSGVAAPVQPPATTFVTLEALFGQFYIAVVVAQLVGARLANRSACDEGPR
jgi:hypothetical protein